MFDDVAVVVGYGLFDCSLVDALLWLVLLLV